MAEKDLLKKQKKRMDVQLIKKRVKNDFDFLSELKFKMVGKGYFSAEKIKREFVGCCVQ